MDRDRLAGIDVSRHHQILVGIEAHRGAEVLRRGESRPGKPGLAVLHGIGGGACRRRQRAALLARLDLDAVDLGGRRALLSKDDEAVRAFRSSVPPEGVGRLLSGTRITNGPGGKFWLC